MPLLIAMSDIMGVKTDDALAHVLILSGGASWALGVITLLCLRWFVDEDQLRSDPELPKVAFRSWPPYRLLTRRGRIAAKWAAGFFAVGILLGIATWFYVHEVLAPEVAGMEGAAGARSELATG